MFKVLVVDDDTMVRIAMKTMIDWKACGFTLCGTAENGHEALALVRTWQPELVITDVDMPGMNGLELIRQLHRIAPQCQILILSNYSDFSYVREGLREGALDYILKVELSQETLLRALEQAGQVLKKQERPSPATGAAALLPTAEQLEELFLGQGGDENAPCWVENYTLYQVAISTDSLKNGAKPLKQAAIRKEWAGVLTPAGELPFLVLSPCTFLLLDGARISAPARAASQIQAQLKAYVGYEAEVRYQEGLQGCAALLQAKQKFVGQTGGLRPEVQQVCDILRRELDKKLTLNALAQSVGLQKSYLCTVFKSEIGQSIGEYLMECRLQKAWQLLQSPGYRVNEVGELVGFADPLYFSRVFKRRYGVPPSQFKK